MKAQKSHVDGAKLRRLREELSLTIEQLAADTQMRASTKKERGISAKTIWRLEHGGRGHPDTIQRLADALGVEPKDLLAGGESPVPVLSAHLCDFHDYIEDRLSGFVGRTFVFEAIDDFITHHDCGYFFVHGDPGIGKSTIAAHLVRERDYVHHFNIRAEGINTTEVFIRNICAQLIIDHELDHREIPPDAAADDRFLATLLKEAAQRQDAKGKIVIVVDALDEVNTNGTQSHANLLCLPPRLPTGIFFVLTARREPLPLRIECCQGEFQLEADADQNMKDIEDYLRTKTSGKGIQTYTRKHRLTKQDFISHMKTKSQGNFMYLRHVLPEIEGGAYKDLEFTDIPAGLQNYYEDHWRRMEMMALQPPAAKIKIIYILSELCEPVSRKLIADFSGEAEVYVQQVLDEWEQFLHKRAVDGETCFSLYHNSFRDFLGRREIVQAAGVSIEGINRLIAENLFTELYGNG